MLSNLDIIIIILFIGILLVYGFISAKVNTKESFLLANRKLNTRQAVSTIASSKIGAGLILSYAALVYTYGISAMWLFVGYVFGYRLFYFFAKKIKKLSDKKKYYTLSDFFFDRYGKTAGILTTSIVAIVTFGWALISLIGGAEIMTTYFDVSFVWSIILLGSTVLTYMIIGGFKSIIKTDKIQFIGMTMIGVIMIYLFIFQSNGINTHDIIGSSLSMRQIISFFLAGVLLPMASAELRQRVYAIKDTKTMKKSFITIAIFYLFFGLVLGLTILLIKNQIADVNANNILFLGFEKLLPSGLIGLSIIIFYSIIMSSIDTSLFTSSSAISQNILSKLKILKNLSLVLNIRITIFVLTMMAMIFSIILKNILSTTYFFVSLIIGLGTTIIGLWIFPKIKKYAINTSLIFIITGVIVTSIVQGISTNLAIYSIILSILGIIIGSITEYYKK